MDRPLSEKNIYTLKKKFLLRLVLILLIIMSVINSVYRFLTPSVHRETVRTAIVQQGPITATINAGGVVIPMSEETINSELKTRITKP